MPKDDKNQIQGTAEAPATAAAPAFKVGQFATITETIAQGPQKGIVVTNLFLISEVGTTTGAKRDEKGNVITKKAMVKFGDGEREVTQAVMETVPVFGGIIISAQAQFTTPRRGVQLGNLSALEA